MSYADVAAKGPKQTPEEAAAPAPPQIIPNESEPAPHRTIDVNSEHVNTVVNEYKGETDTQVERMQREADDAEKAAKKRFQEAEDKASKEYAKGKAEAKEKAKEAKSAVKRAGHELDENKDNPVVIGNAVIWTVIAATLGYNAYKQHSKGKLDWKVASTWAGVVGLFAGADYYVSQYLFKNKYPRK